MGEALKIAAIIILILIAALIPTALIFGPQLISYVQQMAAQPTAPPPAPPALQVPALPPDAARYYSMKKLSCQALSKGFLIVTTGASAGFVSGPEAKIPEESAVASGIASSYDYSSYVPESFLALPQ